MTIAEDIEDCSPTEPRLSLIHTTSVGAFRQICGSGVLEVSACRVMCASLVYLFYGRPAYRPGPIDRTSRNLDARPVCLLFETDVDASDATYPCDTGAHHAGRYAPYLDGITFTDLNCASVAIADQRIVSRFFGTNDEYVYGTGKPVLEPPTSSRISLAFHSLLITEDERSHDDRCLSIEIQRTRALPLEGSLRAILVPDFLTAEPEVDAKLEHWIASGVRVKPYRPQTVSNAARTVERLFPTVAELQGIAT